MSKKDVYIFMYKDYDVLSFYPDFRKKRVHFLKKLEHFDKAPYGFDDEKIIEAKLNSFLISKCIPEQRTNYKEIISSTKSRNGFNLFFKGHGLSLSNHYWFRKENENLRYEDVNFFDNKWDDSFARAVIKEDYEALSHVNLNVPDIATNGWGVKGWLYDEKIGPRLYKIGIHHDSCEEALGEVLASKLAQRLFKKGEVLQYDLENIYGKYASVSSPMIGVDEELIPLYSYLPSDFHEDYRLSANNKIVRKKFMKKLKDSGYQEIYTFFTKLLCLKTLCFVSDLHFGNISVIKNTKTGEYKMAPIYDLGGSFGSGATAKKQLQNRDKSTLLLIFFLYGNLDPDWDYSWYDKDSLIGFEDEIREILSKSEFYTPDIIDFIIEIFKRQKSSLDEMAIKK